MEERANLWALARTLSPSQYDVLWLRYAEALSIQEIARVTRKSQVHVRVTLYRARVAMAKKLEADVEGESMGQPRIGGRGSFVETEGV